MAQREPAAPMKVTFSVPKSSFSQRRPPWEAPSSSADAVEYVTGVDAEAGVVLANPRAGRGVRVVPKQENSWRSEERMKNIRMEADATRSTEETFEMERMDAGPKPNVVYGLTVMSTRGDEEDGAEGGEGGARGGRGEGGERGVAVGAQRWAEVQAWRAVYSSLPRVRPYTGNLRAIPQRDLVQSPQRDFGPGSPGDFPGQNGLMFFIDSRLPGAPATRQAGTSRSRMPGTVGAGGIVVLHHLMDQDMDEDGLDKSGDKVLNTPELKAGKKRSAPLSVKSSVKKAKTDASPKPEQVSLTGKKGRNAAQGMPIGKEAEPPTNEGLKPAKSPKGMKKVGDHKCTSCDRI